MSAVVGARASIPVGPSAEPPAKATKADLLKQCEELGIEAPKKATVAQLKALIDEAG